MQKIAATAPRTARLPRRAVEVKCYGKWETFPSRKKAFDFFLEGAFACDGAESDRYMNICRKLQDGYRRCTDDWDITAEDKK